MIPVELGSTSTRRAQVHVIDQEAEARVDLDLLEEIREFAHICEVATKQRVARHFNKKVRSRKFKAGDLVLRRVELARKDRAQGKFAPTWEGPFRVKAELGKGAYKLEELSGKEIPRTWNSDHLKYYFS